MEKITELQDELKVKVDDKSKVTLKFESEP